MCLLLHLVLLSWMSVAGVHANSIWTYASIEAVTRVSASAASIEFRYYHQPGQTLVFEVLDASTQNTTANFSVGSDLASERKVYYDYLYEGLEENQLYCFRIAAIIGGSWSPQVNDLIPSCLNSTSQTPLLVPRVTSNSFRYIPDDHNTSKVSFQWEFSDVADAILYCIQENSSFLLLKVDYNSTINHAALVGFQSFVLYTCYVCARSEHGVGYSDSVTFTARPNPPYVTVSDLGPHSVDISWTHKSQESLNFTVFVKRGCEQDTASIVVGSQEMVTINSLSPFTYYCVYVTAAIVGVNSTSPPSPTEVVRTLETVPGPVSNLQATPASNTSVFVSWSEPVMKNGIILQYVVEVGERYLSTTGAITFIEVDTLGPCTTHTFRVAASTSSGRGNWRTVHSRTLYPVPAKPVVQEVDRHSRTIHWTIPTLSVCVLGSVIRFQPVYSIDDPITVNYRHQSGSSTVVKSLPSDVKRTVTYNISITSYGYGGTSEPSLPYLSSPLLTSSPHSVDQTEFLQIHLLGVEDCSNWKMTVSSEEVADVLLYRLSLICLKDTNHTVQSSTLLCVGSNQVLFRTRLIANEEFFRCLEHWYISSSPFLRVSNQLLLVDNSCQKLYITSLTDKHCLPNTAACSNTAAAVGSLIGGLILGALIAATIIIVALLVCFRRKIFQRNTKRICAGSCTVLNTVGTTYMPPTLPIQKTRADTDEQYEDLSYFVDGEEVETNYNDTSTSNSNKVKASRSTSHPAALDSKKKPEGYDPEYEVPDIFRKDRQKALSTAATKPSSEYDVPEGVEGFKTSQAVPKKSKKHLKHGQFGQELPPDRHVETAPQGPLERSVETKVPGPAAYLEPLTAKPLVKKKKEDASSKPQLPKLKNNAGKKPILPTKKMQEQSQKQEIPPSSTDQPDKGQKKRPLLPMKSAPDKAPEKTLSIAAKTKMFELGGTGAPAPKPKPKSKDVSNIVMASNSAYRQWEVPKTK